MRTTIRYTCYAICSCLLSLTLPAAAQQGVLEWYAYDQSADLAQLAQHPDEGMHYQLLNSQVLDKNELWAPFNAALVDWTQEDYARLRPLILERTVPQLQQAVAQGQLSYEDLLLFYVYRLREVEMDNTRYLNAVIALNPAALTLARELDMRRAQGEAVALDGIRGMPVLLKDNIGLADLPTTAGALALQENQTTDAFITQQLKAQDAIILGKANLSEWAYFFCTGCPSGYSAMGGQTLNPYGRFRFGTGGSSSGSGVATAANLAALTVGSETSGSILSPASANSAVGLKPTTGALSRSGIVPISATLDTAGPITKSVQDAVILFNAMAGFDANDPAMPLLSEDLQLDYRLVSLSGMRLGALARFLDESHYTQALSLLSGEGALMVDLVLPEFDSTGFSQFLGAEMVRDLALYLDAYAAESVAIDSVADLQSFNNQSIDLRAPYGQALVDMMAELQLDAQALADLREDLQTRAQQLLDQLFSDNNLDALLSINNRNASLAALANYPALTIPMGYEEDGRPIGLTLIAPSFAEQTLIDVGAQFERVSQARRMPAGYAD